MASEREVQDWLYRYLYKKGQLSICPCYTPAGWFECDMFAITKTGCYVEYEIKLTVADFRADAKKSDGRDERYDKETRKFVECAPRVKHAQLAAADPKGPSAFYYVVPAGLIEAKDVPVWAGLIHFDTKKWCGSLSGMSEIKRAPKLHKCKVSPAVIQHVNGVFFWRYWTMRSNLAAANAQIAMLEKLTPPAPLPPLDEKPDEQGISQLYNPGTAGGTSPPAEFPEDWTGGAEPVQRPLPFL
jgi:hypothetical protein